MPEQAPPQDVKEPVAVRVTLEFASTVALQVEVQLIKPLAPVTVPVPVTETVSVCDDAPATNPALTV